MPPEVWHVRGIDQHGEPFSWPDGTEDSDWDLATEAEAVRTADRINRLGGKVAVYHMRWNSPYAGYLPAGVQKASELNTFKEKPVYPIEVE
jgi:hypothetical protein